MAHKWQPELHDLPSYQHMIIGLISGAMGPFSNAPIDTIKTRTCFCPRQLSRLLTQNCTGLQKATTVPGTTAVQRIVAITSEMWKQEGYRSFYKGITPRVIRVAPGQAVVFAVYERVRRLIESVKETTVGDSYSE